LSLAIGCTLRVEFDPNLWKEYTVPVQYRTRLEARLAAVLKGCEEGLLEFIRFKDKAPPPGYNRDSWRTKHLKNFVDIKVEDQDTKMRYTDTRRHSYPQGKPFERYDRRQGLNAHNDSIPRGPRMAGPVRNHPGRYRHGRDSLDMREGFTGQSPNEGYTVPSSFPATAPFESIGSTPDHRRTPGFTQNQDASSRDPGLPQYAIVRGHSSHVSENVYHGGGGPVPMVYEQSMQFAPVPPVPPPLLYPSEPFSHAPVHVPFPSQPHFVYPYPPIPNHHPSQAPGYPILPPGLPPHFHSPIEPFGPGGPSSAPPFFASSERQLSRIPPESYDGRRLHGPVETDRRNEPASHRVMSNQGSTTDFGGTGWLNPIGRNLTQNDTRTRSNSMLNQGGLSEIGSTRPSSVEQVAKKWDSSTSALPSVHENADKGIQGPSSSKGDGPVPSNFQPAETKGNLNPPGRQVKNGPGVHVDRPVQSHKEPASSETARFSPTTMHRISSDRKGSHEASLLGVSNLICRLRLSKSNWSDRAVSPDRRLPD
jgi:hypothetical protein